MSIKELGQIFLLTPVFPLIGAVLGYIFGREAAHGAVHQQQVGQQQQADQATAPTPQEEGHQEEAQS
jgi:hypothetical protein